MNRILNRIAKIFPSRNGSTMPSEDREPEESHRTIYVNTAMESPSTYATNKIFTAKYNIWTFFPKFLFEQFRRYANIFFLVIGLLQQIPDVSPTGRYVTIVPLIVILTLTAFKELIEDLKRHKDDDDVNNRIIKVLDKQSKSWRSVKWKEIVVGDIVQVIKNEFFPADLVLLASSEKNGICYIETSNLDGETNIKIRSSLPLTSVHIYPSEFFEGLIECEPPNGDLYRFVCKIKSKFCSVSSPLSSQELLLRGAKLVNTSWIAGVVVYAGHESKLLMNATPAPLKRSHVDLKTNSLVIFLFVMLAVIAVVSALGNLIKGHNSPFPYYIGPKKPHSFLFNVLTFFILYNNLVPISLQVTLEFVKFIQAFFINWDEEMYHSESKTYAKARTSNLNEELGQIQYLFSDKTGTLTRNVMEFKRASISGILYEAKTLDEVDLVQFPKCDPDTFSKFFLVLSICHTVIPDYSGPELVYNSSSPDEKALVEGARFFGYEFKERNVKTVKITVSKKELSYEILNVLEFTSERKRMSVIVRDPNGLIEIYTKGADNVILEILGTTERCIKYLISTRSHVSSFAREGLRTLCIGYRTISQNEYDSWSLKWHEASIAMKDKETKIAEVASLIEKNLVLLGATGVEDKLQDGVPDAIDKLLRAGIKVWVLTGDKRETAINIGHSCKLLNESSEVIILNGNSLDDVRGQINQIRTNLIKFDKNYGLVIDGRTLYYALTDNLKKEFIELCCNFKSVICCRVSPLQKAEVVQLVKDHTNAITLSIGDGANDVAMIQKADVGVGISGNEGLQAANSSDFSIGQFKFILRLLFVHGAWNHSRISKVILYSFYKNICLYIIELWFAFYNYWSGQVLFERWTIGMYNIFFTSAPPIVIGLFDRKYNPYERLNNPSLYMSSQKSESFNHKIFAKWIGLSILHSIILFWVPVLSYDSKSVWYSGFTGDYLVIGNIVYTLVVITVCLKAWIELDSRNIIIDSAIWGSVVFWFLFLFIYSWFWPLGLPLAANMAGMIQLIISTWIFWLSLIMVPISTIMTDVTWKFLEQIKTSPKIIRADAEAKHTEDSPLLEIKESSSISLKSIKTKESGDLPKTYESTQNFQTDYKHRVEVVFNK